MQSLPFLYLHWPELIHTNVMLCDVENRIFFFHMNYAHFCANWAASFMFFPYDLESTDYGVNMLKCLSNAQKQIRYKFVFVCPQIFCLNTRSRTNSFWFCLRELDNLASEDEIKSNWYEFHATNVVLENSRFLAHFKRCSAKNRRLDSLL